MIDDLMKVIIGSKAQSGQVSEVPKRNLGLTTPNPEPSIAKPGERVGRIVRKRTINVCTAVVLFAADNSKGISHPMPARRAESPCNPLSPAPRRLNLP